MAEHTEEELHDLKVSELKDVARDLELEGYSSLRKAELVDAILAAEGGGGDDAGTGDVERVTTEPEERTATRTTTIRRPGEDGELEDVEVERSATDRIAAVAEGVEPKPGKDTVEAGSIDPVLAKRRQERIDARGEDAPPTPPRTRPTPASIDPRLVERREANRAQEADRERPATEPPSRG